MRLRRALAALLVAAATMPFASFASFASPAHAAGCGPEPTMWATTMTDVEIPMRDGVCLRANLWLPAEPGRYPVVFSMTPYRKDDPRITKPSLVDAGYVYALVDVRGIGHSGGTYDNVFSPEEQADGADLAHWFAAPDRLWNAGQHQKVGMMGQSYLGITQWFAAAQPGVAADLGAIFPCKAYSDIYRDIVYHGGILDALFVAEWGIGTGAWWTLPPAPWTDEGASPAVVGAWIQHLGNEPVILKALERPFDDELYQERSVYPVADRIEVPAYHCGGWYDGFLRGTLDTWRLVGQRDGRPDRMVIGPWPHSGYDDFAIAQERIAWFDRWLKGVPNGIDTAAEPITMFVMRGASQTDGRWRTAPSWPLPETQWIDWYLRRGAVLSPAVPDGAEPGDVLATLAPAGGTLTAGRWSNVSGVTEFEQVDQRPDEAFASVYTTPAFSDDVELTGPLVLHLWASTTAPDVDLFAKVTDVAPDGRSTYLTEGFLRASHRALAPPCSSAVEVRCSLPWQPFHPHQGTEVVPIAEAVPYEIEIWPTANTFPAGHSLRLDLSTSDVPNHFTPPRPGTVTFLHDAQHPSRLTLPVIVMSAAAAGAVTTPSAPLAASPAGSAGVDTALARTGNDLSATLALAALAFALALGGRRFLRRLGDERNAKEQPGGA